MSMKNKLKGRRETMIKKVIVLQNNFYALTNEGDIITSVDGTEWSSDNKQTIPPIPRFFEAVFTELERQRQMTLWQKIKQHFCRRS